LFGTSEPLEQEALSRFLQPGGVFYDIGANVGFFATLAAKLVGANGRVYAFEPNPACAAMVRRNATLNAFAHLTVVEAAVSSRSGRTMLRLGEISGTSSIVRGPGPGIDVAVVSIDEFVSAQAVPLPTTVMIDAEGAEIDVLKGMKETIASARPLLMCEVHWIGPEFVAYFSDEIAPLGYVMTSLEGGDIPENRARFHVILQPTPTRPADKAGFRVH
jgi:FkbM family methyltransferase